MKEYQPFSRGDNDDRPLGYHFETFEKKDTQDVKMRQQFNFVEIETMRTMLQNSGNFVNGVRYQERHHSTFQAAAVKSIAKYTNMIM